MTSAKNQVLLRVKGKPKLHSRSLHERSKQDTDERGSEKRVLKAFQKLLHNIFIDIPKGTMLNTFDKFTLFQYFGQRPFPRKNMHFSIHYIVSVPPF